ncbi:2-amino-4-hydroxy-6-hydroxymethyldihydropteridine diphosphokinase [Solimicrobium silvestre]|uniref:2-amino-4-hydroxy-6-hydroxymethyldihydropteridine pyrophosphokinase n=1 Tax=Solimicrobium silvestre TaxID=2099400 RepID=A0A2S9GTH4_9BURK|nr:2-amino-4-hydroxy-6-hydroxymethyldihydropteridine diphosphokinase [Solimicrobium silvestre]PRC91017.1 folK: 2-amino-4-hydroxy-6-hydroxymethyldihydropteridine diphosphokinase [Solimicrobium silvestre]
MKQAEGIAYIGLGANLGDPQDSINAAIVALGALPSTRLTQASSLYTSAPMDADGDDYVNAVVELHTQLSPTELLSELQNLEQQFGRIRSYQNAPRTLDLDLLLYEQLTINTATLQVPHPRMTQRAFVMVPLLEISPEINIPDFGSAHTLLPALCDQVIQKIA